MIRAKHFAELIVTGIFLGIYTAFILHDSQKHSTEKSSLIFISICAFILFLYFVYNLYAVISPDNFLVRRQNMPYEPEKNYTVTVTDQEIYVTYKKSRSIERVRWDDLQLIEIVTTDDGPFRPDFFYLLHGSNGGCSIPIGAVHFDEMFCRLQQLPHFKNEAVIAASSSAQNERFEVWRRQKQ